MKVETKKAIVGKRDTCTITIMPDGGIMISNFVLEPDESCEFCNLLLTTLGDLQKQVRKERGELK